MQYLQALFVLLLLLPSLVLANHSSLRDDPFNTLPDSSASTFPTNIRIYLGHEDSQREGELVGVFIRSGGLHGTSGSLTSPAFSTVAHVPERVSQASTAITYAAIANDVCWTIISSDNNGITGWTRVGTTAYYYQCEGDTTPNRPALPANSAWLMGPITITGSAIATVVDARLPASYARHGVFDPTDNLYGAVPNDNSVDNTAAIQSTIAATCGPGGLAQNAANRGKMRVPSGVYRTLGQLDIPPACFGEFYGDSVKGTYIYQQGGTGSALRIRGSLCTTCGNVAPRTSSNNDGSVYLHDISLGSTVGHGLSLVNAYETLIERVRIFSAGVASNFIDLDGVSTFVANDPRTNGNDDFPAEWATAFLGGRTQGLRGIYITSRAVAGSYNLSGQITLNRPRIEGQQTQHAIEVALDAAADFTIYPVIINDPDLIVRDTYAGVAVDKGIAIVNGGYCERISGTVDAVRVNTVTGTDSAIYVSNMISNDTCDVNYNGNGVNAGSLIVKGGRYRTWLSANSSYHLFHMEGARFTTQTTSPYANYTAGEHTKLTDNVISVSNTIYPIDSFQDMANDTDPIVQRFTYIAASPAAPIIQCRKARGTLSARTAITAADAVCGLYFMGFSNSDYRTAAYMEVIATIVAASNLAGRFDWHLSDGAGVDVVAARTTLQGIEVRSQLFANLGTPSNGTFVYCSDCTRADPCAGGGAGAWAFRDQGNWKCNAIP